MSSSPQPGGAGASSEPCAWAFDAEDEDHCETPGRAYDHVAWALRWVAGRLGKSSRDLAVYDPYFCRGTVVSHLAARGFPRVHNRNEDFYAVAAAGRCPPFDCVVTNPPYSGNHVERILRFCAASGKPWFLLVPNFVYTNSYFAEALRGAASGARPCFLVPRRERYEYMVPRGVRRAAVEVKTAPFLSFWFVGMPGGGGGGGDDDWAAAFIRAWRAGDEEVADARNKRSGGGADEDDRPLLAGHASQLPHNMRAQYDKTRRRLRKKQREAEQRRKRRREEVAEEALQRAKASEPCRFGAACCREGCWFSHPWDHGGESN